MHEIRTIDNPWLIRLDFTVVVALSSLYAAGMHAAVGVPFLAVYRTAPQEKPNQNGF